MKVRNKSISIDEAQFLTSRDVILHPEFLYQFLEDLYVLEMKGKVCRVPSTLFETYHLTMPKRVALFEESCRKRDIVLSS